MRNGNLPACGECLWQDQPVHGLHGGDGLLLVLTAIMVCVNMLFCFFGAKLFKCDLEDAIIASNANIGGPTTAAGMAISQGWTKLVGPAMLVGVLGYVVGNYLGTIVGIVLGA